MVSDSSYDGTPPNIKEATFITSNYNVLVGAPEAQTDQPGVQKGGAVYFCEINGESCGQLVFDSSGSNTHEGEQIDSKSNQWFGATVRSSGSIILPLKVIKRFYVTY
ncbi:hypothetical protein O3M35_012407 [Rhynocoris fuscipes]|uniref:Uncharacterized protein n=1 Tax=Rhynocoris fuscipes TaxID=488301 RepID=A0AAW1CS94_9HEMI